MNNGPYRVSREGEVPSKRRTVTDAEAMRHGLAGIALGPAVFICVLLFALPALTIGASVELVRYARFRAVKMGHIRLGIDNTREYQSAFAGAWTTLVESAAHLWGRTKSSADMILWFTLAVAATLNAILISAAPMVVFW